MNSPQSIFLHAREVHDPAQRAAYLDGACAGDAALRDHIEALLADNTAADAYFDEVETRDGPSLSPVMPLATTELMPEQIGPYRILERIGHGGMGDVYRAEQRQPIRREVALKLVKLGLDSRQVIVRFEAERQALAMMDHPNIARVFDAGTDERGRPYFVMELVRGEPITQYADRHLLPLKERLTLLQQVCHAVQHAHSKGIIHRDLKPGNILVSTRDGRPLAKVIDFGIAKATAAPLTDGTLFTEFHQFIGTPQYMSPEQAEGSLDIDTRSDVYSLGVLLYELLTGYTPFDVAKLKNAALGEIARYIREEEPPKPSTRLGTLATRRDMPPSESTVTLDTLAKSRALAPEALVRQVRGELDWLVMKSLEKDRNRRYETPNGLAEDIARYLDGQPILAAPPSAAYRVGKFIRKRKGPVIAGCVVMLALAVGGAGLFLGFQRAIEEAEMARRAERTTAEALVRTQEAELEQRRLIATAEASERLAKENFDQARSAVRELLAVADEYLRDIPGTQPIRLRLMRTIIEEYRPFFDRRSEDPAPRAELARVYATSAFVSIELGEDYDAIVRPAYEQAFLIQNELVRDYPGSRTFRSDLGWTHFLFVWGTAPGPRLAQSRDEAVRIFRSLVEEVPNDPFARCDLAWSLRGRARDMDVSEKNEFLDESLAIREQLVKEFPLSAEFRRDLANSLVSKAESVLSLQGYPAARLLLLNRAAELRNELIKDIENKDPEIWKPARPLDSEARIFYPGVTWMKRDLASGLIKTAELQAEQNQFNEAAVLLERGITIYRKLVEQNPEVKLFSSELLRAKGFVERLEIESGKIEEGATRK